MKSRIIHLLNLQCIQKIINLSIPTLKNTMTIWIRQYNASYIVMQIISVMLRKFFSWFIHTGQCIFLFYLMLKTKGDVQRIRAVIISFAATFHILNTYNTHLHVACSDHFLCYVNFHKEVFFQHTDALLN